MKPDVNTAVEIVRKDDTLDIWVDANNNGRRDDDDVNIIITASGGIYTTSPTFKKPLDSNIQNKIKEVGVSILSNKADIHQHSAELVLRNLALELVQKAIEESSTPRELPPLPPGVRQ